MSVRSIDIGEFRNIQAELDALSITVNAGNTNPETIKALDTLQNRLNSCTHEIAQCQLKLDGIKSAFQRGVAAPLSKPTPHEPASQSFHTQSQPSHQNLSTLMHKASFQPSPSETTSEQTPTSPFPMQGSFSSPAIQSASGSTPPTVSQASAQPTDLSPQEILKRNREILEEIKSKNSEGSYYWTWFKNYTVAYFREVTETGTYLMTKEDQETFRIECSRLLLDINARKFDPLKELGCYLNEMSLTKPSGSLIAKYGPLNKNPSLLKLLEIYDPVAYSELRS